MHPELATVFAFFAHKFPALDVAIGGSSVRVFDAARDIDVMVLASADYPFLVGRLGSRYCGWDVVWTNPTTHSPLRAQPTSPPVGRVDHLRRTVRPIWLEGVSKPVQLCQSSALLAFTDHPHCLLLADGSYIHEGCFHTKPPRPPI